MFPDAKIVHIKRDPRGVAYSLSQQTWAPGNVSDALKILTPIYDRWQNLKSSLHLPPDRYIEIKSETFFTDCRPQIDQLLDWLGAGPAEMDTANITPDRIDSWRGKIAPADLELCNRKLSPYLVLMGYDDK